MSGSKRRAFIALVNRGLERVLHVRDEQEFDFVVDEQPTAVVDEQEEQYQRNRALTLRINELRRLLLLIPRGIRNRFQNSETMNRIREIIHNADWLSQLPDDLLNELREFNLF